MAPGSARGPWLAWFCSFFCFVFNFRTASPAPGFSFASRAFMAFSSVSTSLGRNRAALGMIWGWIWMDRVHATHQSRLKVLPRANLPSASSFPTFTFSLMVISRTSSCASLCLQTSFWMPGQFPNQGCCNWMRLESTKQEYTQRRDKVTCCCLRSK